jgi:glycosyltransferase involved in cell wall biosynthesis
VKNGRNPKQKRVCIVRNSYYPAMVPNRRNAETLVANGYEVDVLCMRKRGQKRQETINGVRVYRLPLERQRKGIFSYAFEYSAFFFLAFWTLAWLSLRRRYQVIEVSGMPDFMVFTVIIPKLMGVKVIFNLLDHMPEVCDEKYKLGPRHVVIRLLRLTETVCAGWVDHVIVVNTLCKKLMEDRGISGSKLSISLNVPDYTVTSRSSHGSENGAFRLITHGSLLERYGVQTLIKALPELINEIPHLEVKVVGDGEYRPQLEELARSLGVTKYIDFTGWVPQIEVPAYIAGADIGIVTITADKNPMLPNKLFEYLDVGKPTVSTAIPAIKAYFTDDSVMYYKPGNEHDLIRCILELYRNPEKRAALAASGASAYQKYRWDVTKYEYLKVFNKLTKN